MANILMLPPEEIQPSAGEQIFTALLKGVGKYQKGIRDRQIREAIMREMGQQPPQRTKIGGVLNALFGQPPLSETEEKIYPEIIKQKITPREWKPTTREEALEFEEKKAGIKEATEALKRVTGFQEKAAGKGWELGVSPELPPERQVEAVRRLFATKVGEKKLKEITPAQALNILSDPLKSQQVKRLYPDLYKKLEEIVKATQGQTGITTEESLTDVNW